MEARGHRGGWGSGRMLRVREEAGGHGGDWGLGRRLLQCPGKKRQWQCLLDGEERLDLAWLHLPT